MLRIKFLLFNLHQLNSKMLRTTTQYRTRKKTVQVRKLVLQQQQPLFVLTLAQK